MYKGLSTEFLLQLFFIFEGFTFWTVIELPAKTGVTASDYEDACQQILDHEGKASDKIDEGIKFQKSRFRYLRWEKTVGYFEKGYVSGILIATFLIISSWIDTSDEIFRLFFAFFIAIYETIKLICYHFARKVYLEYKNRLESISKISHTLNEINSGDFSLLQKGKLKKAKAR